MTNVDGDAGPPIRVMWVGNSYTYYNNLMHLFFQLGKRVGPEGGPKTDLRQLCMTEPRKGFLDHAGDFEAVLGAFQPSILVLQDVSHGPGGGDAELLAKTRESIKTVFGPAIAKVKSVRKVVLFQTWGRETMPLYPGFLEMNQRTKEGYEQYKKDLIDAGVKESSVEIARVGDAFRWLHDHAKVLWQSFYFDDIGHPTVPATLLVAFVVFLAAFETAQMPDDDRLLKLPVVVSEDVRTLLKRVAVHVQRGGEEPHDVASQWKSVLLCSQ
uniref:SGNH hydrolase-type esterase domain-containing protein n=1 Tax=Chromera velia CCMP2878 TaxID=1169474 RepID=A0A0G4GYD5_9ALVE|eukprot:Cvel_5406.t1-p1 / transcript=Cvel_5406.t1 / gene=Cvel_5406 / organism=Chromera_velia_CCMP2878 / gene_product=hypothetical protein / transcript_product=hypothetical protein / location=Cvel_scaffold251:103491-105726(+) / protein_length=268 / sequence_SO=supercontig / SO=protein_coding / is_pseudo=false